MPTSARHPKAALHTVALFEATKGALVIAVGFGLLALIHRDVQALAEEIVRHLHLNPASRIPRIFLEAAGKADGGRLQLLALGAFGYASVRFAEAWGLWRGRPWAEWLGIISGGIYLPAEIYELFISVTPVKLGTFLVNFAVVAVLARERLNARRAARKP
ncbi:DUF2127 domain-containing protein [Geobacter hydrogenophilus]|uniref:Membrane protein n=1 Tax=Geobacter hydrogenophilus TaxID=40983 RepID=A0A9W6G2W5_9BACT|nr:DUF2127 domain-containing protein [Geobacter hydrogenophilus]MBT0892582.1 DUF2127 domain-containing protein [Geobacter hydrogenophilus]GLI39979.1 membrane protein [Geobacter hydrogenophilus]